MATQKTQRVKVIRAFFQRGQVRGVGSVLDLPAPLAAELRHARKVEFVQADTKIHESDYIPPPQTAAPAAAPGEEKKGASK